MKKIVILTLCLSCMLAGCGKNAEDIAPESGASPAVTEPEETAAEETTEEETTEPETEAPTEPETDAPTEPETEPPTEAPASSRENVIAAYKKAIQEKIDASASYNGNLESINVSYALYDMDYDGIPELLVHYGTCEADFQIAIYTYRNGALKLIADALPGSHTGFGFDYVANQIVLCQGHMGYGEMLWYDLDDNGDLRFLISTDGFEYAGEDTPEYEDYMKKYNVAWLDESEFFGKDTTWVITYPGGVYQNAEYGGFDYRFLENYKF